MVQQQTVDFVYAFLFIAMALIGGVVLIFVLGAIAFFGPDSTLIPDAALGFALIAFSILGVVLRARAVRPID